MKYLAILLTFAFSSALIATVHPDHLHNQPEHPSDHPEHPSDQPDHPEHPSDHPDSTDDSTASKEAAQKAEALLKAVHEKYKNAKVLSETIILEFPSFMPGEKAEIMKIESVFGAKSGKIIAQDQMTAIYKDGAINITINEFDDAYISHTCGSFYEGVNETSDEEGLPGLWTLALRDSDSMESWLSALSMGMPGAEVESVTTRIGGHSTININSKMGKIAVNINPDTTITSVVMTISQPGMPEMQIKSTCDVTILDEMPEITFDAGDREKYASMEEMFEAMEESEEEIVGVKDGSDAPDFTLKRMNGSGKVTLSDLKGSVVVLDFWATWCGPCKRGLPFLNEFYTWAKNEGVDVKIFAVNVWEEGQEERVKKFWADNKYLVPVLMGSDDKKLTDNYGISGIPTTFIIGTDGTVIEQHSGFRGGKEMVAGLKKAVTEAIASAAE